jgi:hypothetical protein
VWLTLLFLIWLAAPVAPPSVLRGAAVAEGAGGDCSAFDARNQPEFLACVVVNLKSGKDDVDSVNRSAPDLVKLSDTVGFEGRSEDLMALKSASTRLKGHPRDNQDAITVLDNAISAHKTELRAMISPATLPSLSIDQYPAFVRRKLSYLLSDAAPFYDGGPFEIVTRSNLATALQEIYFLDAAAELDQNSQLKKKLLEFAGSDRAAWAKRSIAVFDDIIYRLLSMEHDYLPIGLRKYSVNDFRYRRATALLLLGENQRYRQSLKSLAIENQDFSLATTEIDHIYVYKVFYTPYRLTVSADVDSSGHTISAPHIDDPNIVKKLYNPAQLALVSCSAMAEAGPGASVSRLTKSVRDLALSDYYVILASSNERPLLETILKGIAASMKARASVRDNLEGQVKMAEVDGFSQEIKDGATECQIPDEAKKKIFSPFAFDPLLLQMENFGKFRFHLVVGGRLNADQARLIANYVNGDPEFAKLLAPSRTLSSGAYIARMKASN